MAESKEESKVKSSDEIIEIIDFKFGPTENNCCTKSSSIDSHEVIIISQSSPLIDPTLDNNYSEEDLQIIGSVSQAEHSNQQSRDLGNTHSSSNDEDQCTLVRKRKIEEQNLDLLDVPTIKDCSSSKIPKVEPTFTSFVNLSNSTITSANNVHDNIDQDFNDNIIETPNKIPKRIVTSIHLKNPQIYYQVLNIFPDVEKNYLQDLCNRESDLNNIINIILEANSDNSGHLLLQQTPNEGSHLIGSDSSGELGLSSQKSSNIIKSTNNSLNCNEHEEQEKQQSPAVKFENTQLAFLTGVLPDADPSFLETKSRLTETELAMFLYEAMEKRNYPKQIVNTVQKTESSEDEDIGLYTTDFDIERFLQIFPEPFKYFLDENRVCAFSEHSFEFLKRKLRNQTIKLIIKTYKDFGYNMSRTIEALENKAPTRVNKRSLNEIKMPKQSNLPFLQEACFVEHKAEIKSYIESKAEAKRLAYEEAEKRGELIQCGCCYDESMFEDCGACNEGDLFCKNCIKRSAEVRIGDGLNTFPCLLDCGAQFSLHLLQSLLEANIFSRLLKRIQLEEVRAADIEGLEVCPFCEFATIPPPETSVFTCLNNECLKESCRKCHKVSHIPQRCEEVESDDQARARKYIEDEMTKALVRECYRCKKSFIKAEGCNKMTCTCGAKMCYICRKPVVDYNHFNGLGSAEKKKCPLYSTDKVLHVDAVKIVAEESLKKLNSTNPSLKLKHDPTKVLPSSIGKSSLPNGMQENEAALIRRLQYQPWNPEFPQYIYPYNQGPTLCIIPERAVRPNQPHVSNTIPVSNVIPVQRFTNVHNAGNMTCFPHATNTNVAKPNVQQLLREYALDLSIFPNFPQERNHNPTATNLPQVPNHIPAASNLPQVPNHNPTVLHNNHPAHINQPNNTLPNQDGDYLEQLQRLDDIMERIRVELQEAERVKNKSSKS